MLDLSYFNANTIFFKIPITEGPFLDDLPKNLESDIIISIFGGDLEHRFSAWVIYFNPIRYILKRASSRKI